MKRFIYPLFALALGACVDQVTPTADELGAVEASYTVVVEGARCMMLVAGQDIDVGTMCATVVGENLEFTYNTTGGWQLLETHLWVGTSAPGATIPPGQCPFKDTFEVPKTTHTYSVPLATFGFDFKAECVPTTAYAMAHASVIRLGEDGIEIQQETAYCNGPGTPGSNWQMYFTVSLGCETEPPPPPPDPVCESAFAFGGEAATCFIGLPGVDANRWGWTNGPLGFGTYTFDLYAGAGQCKLENGELVGAVEMTYLGRTGIEMTITTTEGVTLDETHVYVGGTLLPMDKRGKYVVAPGQFPYGNDLTDATTDSFSIPATGDVYVVVHAVTCWVPEYRAP